MLITILLCYRWFPVVSAKCEIAIKLEKVLMLSLHEKLHLQGKIKYEP